ncbi:MAG TPA: magnesium transporter CorA family protein [Solirubrobacteraceae bacterium]
MRTLERIDRSEIEELLAREEFFWLDLIGPSGGQLDELAALLGWHPLALEDVKEFGQRPKLDDYRTHALLVFYGAHAPQGTLTEVHVFVSGDWVVTVRRRACQHLDDRRGRVAADPPETEEELVYHVLDALTDSFLPVLEDLEDRLEELEDEIVARPREQQLGLVLALRRQLGPMRRVTSDQRELFSDVRAVLDQLPGLEHDEAADAFRDVSDHLQRIADWVEGLRDRVRDALGLYASTNSNRLNEIITRLTVMATIFLPLTFVVGFFGQNFKWMVDHVESFPAFAVWGVGGSVIPLVVMVWLFWRAGLLARRPVESAPPK